MNLQQRMIRQKNGIDALNRATGWHWEGDGLDGNGIGALVNCRGRIYSKSGSFGAALKFLKSKAQESEAP